MHNKQVCQNLQQMEKKTEKLLFSLPDDPTLKVNFKWVSFDFNMKMKILIILKMPFLILSSISDLILFLVSVNYFGSPSW